MPARRTEQHPGCGLERQREEDRHSAFTGSVPNVANSWGWESHLALARVWQGPKLVLPCRGVGSRVSC